MAFCGFTTETDIREIKKDFDKKISKKEKELRELYNAEISRLEHEVSELKEEISKLNKERRGLIKRDETMLKKIVECFNIKSKEDAF